MSIEYIIHKEASGRTFKTLPPIAKPVAEWFTGALEIGATAGLYINRKRDDYVTAYPYINFQDTKPAVAEWLLNNFGGKVTPTGGSFRWRVGYYVAAGILLDTEPYTASRRELILAVRNWWDADTEERVRIAQEISGYDRFGTGTVKEYLQLLSRPAFVAGAVDYKGLIYPHHDKGYIYPRVDLYSRNTELVQAFEEKFGGQSNIKAQVGQELAIDPRYLEVRNSYSWTASNRQARRLINFANPFLVVQPYECWNRRLVEERKQERRDQVAEIHQYVIEELQAYLRGEISRISRADEIAEGFKLSEKTARRRLVLLPSDIKKQREQILRGSNRQKLTDQEIATIVESILQELRDFQAGRLSRLSYNEQWADLVSVGTHLINRHVIPKLPSVERELRQHLLLSQSTSDRNEVYGNPGAKGKS